MSVPRQRLLLDVGAGPPVELPRKGKLVLGTDPDRAHVVVDAAGVADVHCAIGRLKGGGWAVMDLGSDAGTRVNGESVSTHKLSAGDAIELGDATVHIVRTGAEGQASPAPDRPAESAMPRTGSSNAGPKASAAAKPPTALGGYALSSRLGRGAMGDVYLATQTSLDRKVALKLLKPSLATDARFVERFRTEARAAARLNHPNVVTAYDVGEDQGHHYLSMEYMEGGSLQGRLQTAGRIPWPQAMRAVADAAAGLVYAEAQGIVHRDIKPENLMLGADGTTKIADLGLAVQVEQEGHAELGSKVFGTPHFLAPELLRGEAPTTRSDLYALGTTAYHLIAGRPPFDGADAKAIARKILNDEPPPLGGVVQGVPAAVEKVVHRLMAKDPEDRPESAQAALDEILAASGGESSGGAGKWVAAAVFAILLGVGAWLTLGRGDETPDVPEVPTQDVANGPTDTPGETPSDPEPIVPPEDLGGEPTAPDTTAPSPEEAFEAEAQNALAALGDQALNQEARIAALRALAETYRGTDAARTALAEADGVESTSAAETAAETALKGLREAHVGVLREAAAVGEGTIADALARFAAVPAPPAELSGDAAVAEVRGEILDGLVNAAVEALDAELSAADAAEEQLDYAGTGAALKRAVALELLPPAEALPRELGVEPRPPSIVRLDERQRLARERLADWKLQEATFDAERAMRERADVARTLGSGLADALRSMDLTAARARFEGAADLVSDERRSGALRDTADRLARADAALESLLAAWDEDGWRRTTLRDPRKRDGSRVEVVGVAPGPALMVAGSEGGAPAKVTLDLFGGHTDALADLVEPRVQADRTAAEAAGLAELLAATASLEAADVLRPLFDGEGRAFRFTDEDRERALAPFTHVDEWRTDHPDAVHLAAPHREAVEDLCDALAARAAGDLASATVLVQRLLEDRRDTYLVMLLSDGGRR